MLISLILMIMVDYFLNCTPYLYALAICIMEESLLHSNLLCGS